MTPRLIHTLIFMMLAAITVGMTSAIGAYINRRFLNRQSEHALAADAVKKTFGQKNIKINPGKTMAH